MLARFFPNTDEFPRLYRLGPTPMERPLALAAVRDLALLGARGLEVDIVTNDGAHQSSVVLDRTWADRVFQVGGDLYPSEADRRGQRAFRLRWGVESVAAPGLVGLRVELGMMDAVEYVESLERLARDNGLIARLLQRGPRTWRSIWPDGQLRTAA